MIRALVRKYNKDIFLRKAGKQGKRKKGPGLVEDRPSTLFAQWYYTGKVQFLHENILNKRLHSHQGLYFLLTSSSQINFQIAVLSIVLLQVKISNSLINI
jgi:hypothetical protein